MLGSNEFKKRVTKEFGQTDLGQLRKALENKPRAIEIVKLLCVHFKLVQKAICRNQAAKRQSNPIRAFALNACRHYGDTTSGKIGRQEALEPELRPQS